MMIVNEVKLSRNNNFLSKMILLFALTFNNFAYSSDAFGLPEEEQLFNTGAAFKFIVEEPNYSLACDYFEKSASMGFGPALFNLGLCYASGDGREKNYELALKHLNEAYKKGIIEAGLSSLTMKLEVSTNNEDCLSTLNEIEVFEKETNTDVFYSSFIVGVYWLTGKCGVSDKLKAQISLEKASKNNNPMAQALMYLIYKNGLHGYEKSLEKSNSFKSKFENNPQRNDWSLPFAIAGLYEKGWGVAKNIDISEKYKQEANQLEKAKDSK